MLEIKVDLIPFGQQEGRKRIESMILWNCGHTDTFGECKYRALFFDDTYEPTHYASTTHVRSDGAWVLIGKLVESRTEDIPLETIPIPAWRYYK